MVLFSPCYPFCIHSPYLILILDSCPLFLSCFLSPLPSNSIHHHPFWLCTHCHTLTWHSIPFYYLITRLLHIWCHTILLAGHLDLNFCLLFFPLPTFSYIEYIVSLLDSNYINPLHRPCQGAGNCGPLFPLFSEFSLENEVFCRFFMQEKWPPTVWKFHIFVAAISDLVCLAFLFGPGGPVFILFYFNVPRSHAQFRVWKFHVFVAAISS